MFKLLIADDERIIREAMANIIDWNSLDIQLIGTAKDGIEAYNIILDEYPDIVLTDIKMPGLSGLDLIQKIHAVKPETQFIILSGFGEFEYAKKAMQYGVKHYLLKPCNESQIVEAVNSIKKEYFTNMASLPTKERSVSYDNFYHSIAVNLLSTFLSYPIDSLYLQQTINTYSSYINFKQIPYDLFYIYYVPQPYCHCILEDLCRYKSSLSPGLTISAIYVKNTLIIGYMSNKFDSREIESFLSGISNFHPIKPEYKHLAFDNLLETLKELIPHIKRYDTIYFASNIDKGIITPLNNYQNIITETQNIVNEIFSGNDIAFQNSVSALSLLLSSISNLDFLKQLAISLTITAFSKSKTFDIEQVSNFLIYLKNEISPNEIEKQLIMRIENLYTHFSTETGHILLSSKVKQLIKQHYANPDLSLKWICENYLFMNVDYLSKKFLKETGIRFSKYLTDYRISKAKELMTSATAYSIQEIADQIGCGNNPQYFSQLFRKSTGMTPSQYMRSING